MTYSKPVRDSRNPDLGSSQDLAEWTLGQPQAKSRIPLSSAFGDGGEPQTDLGQALLRGREKPAEQEAWSELVLLQQHVFLFPRHA